MNNYVTPSTRADSLEDEIRSIQNVLGDLALELKGRLQKRITELQNKKIIEIILILLVLKIVLFSGKHPDVNKKIKRLGLKNQKLAMENHLLKRQLHCRFFE